jgi:hypothetical protein
MDVYGYTNMGILRSVMYLQQRTYAQVKRFCYHNELPYG